MKNILLICTILFAGCTTVTVTQNKDLKTLDIFTGTKGENLYTDYFTKKANETCSSGYEVLEKTKEPSTLDKSEWNKYHFYWVIKCK